MQFTSLKLVPAGGMVPRILTDHKLCVFCAHSHTHSNTKICGPPAALPGEGGFGEEAQVGDGQNIASRFALLVVPFLAGRGPAADD